MGWFFESLYIALVFVCFVYFFVLLQNSKSGWQILDLSASELPFVSIIVPTLEEEVNIRKCLTSLTKLNYPHYEIIVVDGGSKDKTVEIARSYGVNVIVDENLPTGWIGKSYGCHVGYQEAQGEVLLFTDADTKHTPDSLKITVSHLLGSDVVLFSMLPYLEAYNFYEFFPTYLYFLSFLCGGPRDDISNPYNKDSFLASGQYMLFTRKGYEELGGHMAISSSLVEDVALAKLCKEKELGLSFIDGTRLVQTRMYPEGFGQFFRAFRRAIWGGIVTLTPWRIGFMLLWLLYFLFSPYFLIQSFFNQGQYFFWGDYTIGIIVNVGLYLAYAATIHFYFYKRGDMKWWISLFYPITQLVNFVVITVAIIYGIRGKKVSWRGRYYSTQGAETLKEMDKERRIFRGVKHGKKHETLK
ncbi:MAG: glycosyltransferase [Candidatus Heimdallarchaeota archaeon]|nr:glycosyltransferase [Candidatus Heimdallarchaeota archaeon]